MIDELAEIRFPRARANGVGQHVAHRFPQQDARHAVAGVDVARNGHQKCDQIAVEKRKGHVETKKAATFAFHSMHCT